VTAATKHGVAERRRAIDAVVALGVVHTRAPEGRIVATVSSPLTAGPVGGSTGAPLPLLGLERIRPRNVATRDVSDHPTERNERPSEAHATASLTRIAAAAEHLL
jgi:hypothetical protein